MISGGKGEKGRMFFITFCDEVKMANKVDSANLLTFS